MKVILFMFFMFLLPMFGFAQSTKDTAYFYKALLYEQFKNGTVLMKSGAVENAPLNYNTEDQTVVFVNDGQDMILTGTELIDTIYIENKKFVPVNNKIYEVVTNEPVALYLSYHNRPRPIVATTDHNGTSRQSSNGVSNTVTDMYTMRNFKGNYNIEIMKDYWLKKDNKLYKADTEKQFIKPFSSQMKERIEGYIKTNHVDFNKEEDLIELTKFCNTLL